MRNAVYVVSFPKLNLLPYGKGIMHAPYPWGNLGTKEYCFESATIKQRMGNVVSFPKLNLLPYGKGIMHAPYPWGNLGTKEYCFESATIKQRMGNVGGKGPALGCSCL